MWQRMIREWYCLYGGLVGLVMGGLWLRAYLRPEGKLAEWISALHEWKWFHIRWFEPPPVREKILVDMILMFGLGVFFLILWIWRVFLS